MLMDLTAEEVETIRSMRRKDSPSQCEDYPCCGHTDGLGCNYDSSYYSSAEYRTYLNNHYGCDHEAGNCYFAEIEPTCDVCNASCEDVDWDENCGCCVEHCQQFEGCE